jgi:hypothetical protein
VAGAENQMPGGSGEGNIGGVGGEFVPGVRLAGEFFAEVVRPLLEAEFPGLGYAAALIGAGSEVLGFDSQRSTDHDWGPRLLVFPEDEEAERFGAAVDEMLGRRIPEVFGGYPVAFGVTRDPGSGIGHRVEIFGLGGGRDGWHRGSGHRQHAGPRRSPLRQGRYLGIWYLIEICRSWGSVIRRPNVGVSSG